MSGHTPGPWAAFNVHGDGWYVLTAKDSAMVADADSGLRVTVPPLARMRGVGRRIPPAEMEANAALVARAPDLLAENARLRAKLARVDALVDEPALTDLIIDSHNHEHATDNLANAVREALGLCSLTELAEQRALADRDEPEAVEP